MADVTVNYKGQIIAALDGTGNKTLKTGGTYCEGDIEVDYAPRCRSYEITLAKASGSVLLTTLDEDVLAHINDDSLIVVLSRVDPYEFTSYAVYQVSASNIQCGVSGNYPVYGRASRQTGATTAAQYVLLYPPNDTSASNSLGGGKFYIVGNKYYMIPADGYVSAGKYRLVFIW